MQKIVVREKRNPRSQEDRKMIADNQRADRQVGLVGEDEQPASASSESDNDNHLEEHNQIHFVDMHEEPRDEFQRVIDLQIQGGVSYSCTARIDTECPITLVQESLIN